MSSGSLIEQLNAFEADAISAIDLAGDAGALEAARIEFLGARQGRLRDLQGLLGQATKEEKPLVGRRFNEVKTKVSAALEARQRVLARPVRQAGGLDVTLPGTRTPQGRRHPLTQTILEFKEIMGRFGFSVADGPEVEDERHNFEALNIPADHPARDPLENFYLAAAQVAARDGSTAPPRMDLIPPVGLPPAPDARAHPSADQPSAAAPIRAGRKPLRDQQRLD